MDPQRMVGSFRSRIMYSLGISLVFCDILLNIVSLHHKNRGVNSCGNSTKNRTLVQDDGLHGDGVVLKSHSIVHVIQVYMEKGGVLVEKRSAPYGLVKMNFQRSKGFYRNVFLIFGRYVLIQIPGTWKTTLMWKHLQMYMLATLYRVIYHIGNVLSALTRSTKYLELFVGVSKCPYLACSYYLSGHGTERTIS